MIHFFQYLIKERVKSKFKKKEIKYTPKDFEKEFEESKIEFSHVFHDSIYIFFGVLSATFGLKAFLLPNSFLDGGVMGISLIAAELSEIPLSILIVLINIPFLLMGYSTIGKSFALKSIIAIIFLSITVYLMPITPITEDKLLISVFGGFFLGLGIGLAIRGGSVIDGTEVLAVFISKKTPLTIGDIILIFNIMIFAIAAYVFSIEIALYAILTYLAASKTVDFVVNGLEEYVGVSIISTKAEEVRLAIVEKMGRGCTVYEGKRGFAERGHELKSQDIIYTLITRLELAKLQTEVDKVDKEAFVIMNHVMDAKGGMIKKRPLK